MFNENKKYYKSRVTAIFERMSTECGYVCSLNQVHSDAGYIQLFNGRRLFFTYGTLDINTYAATEFANDKSLSFSVLKELGIKLPREQRILYSHEKAADEYLSELTSSVNFLGLPVILKPARGRQGRNIFRIDSVHDLNLVVPILQANEDDILVQEYIEADEMRVVVLDGEVIQAYTRDFSHIVGDGIASIQRLIEDKNELFLKRARNTKIDTNDEQIGNLLLRKKYTLSTILAVGERFNLSYGKNLSKGGEYEFIEDKLGKEFKVILGEMAHKTGLRLVGFDLFVFKKPELITNELEIACIEYNASPDMENNFYYDGDYSDRFEKIYQKILKAMMKL